MKTFSGTLYSQPRPKRDAGVKPKRGQEQQQHAKRVSGDLTALSLLMLVDSRQQPTQFVVRGTAVGLRLGRSDLSGLTPSPNRHNQLQNINVRARGQAPRRCRLA